MIFGADVLERLKEHFPRHVERRYVFPHTYVGVETIDCPSETDEREAWLAQCVGVTHADLRDLANRLFLRFEIRRPDEPNELPEDRGDFWMRALQEQCPSTQGASGAPVVHFYGFKGGQARSSVLAFLSKVLADDGWRVLALDMDAEAPSLDLLFSAEAFDAASTVVGLRAGLEVLPVRAYAPARGEGFVELLPFRPAGELFDLEAAALSMEMGIYPPGQTRLAQALAVKRDRYDVLLIDHRTGVAPTVLPWIRQLPGPVVAFARMDGQWRAAVDFFRPLWTMSGDARSLLATACPAHSERNDFIAAHREQAIEVLNVLADSRAAGEDNDQDRVSGEDLIDHWVLWPYDRAFEDGPVPDVTATASATMESVAEFRRLLELTGRKQHQPQVVASLHPSGAKDEGHLIQTRALRQLRSIPNPFTYILGRKGTGKTRLVRVLMEEGLGEPLLVADEAQEARFGFVRDSHILELARASQQDPDRLWWTLLAAALKANTTERLALLDRLEEIRQADAPPVPLCRIAAKDAGRARVFLLDGLETAFSREQTFPFIAALFRMIATVEADPDLREKIRFKVFIRTDLAQRGFENFEQQSYGRQLVLTWDTQSILNFALSRIDQLAWFCANFPDATGAVRDRLDDLKNGSVPAAECDQLMLRFFPPKLSRTNINTGTFLRTYFSDDPKAEVSFYPRVYDAFLTNIASDDARGYSGERVQNGRIAQRLIYYAHEQATQDFLAQVKSELQNIVDLSDNELKSLLDAMRDTITPFSLDLRTQELASCSGLAAASVRTAMERMKNLGIFEDRPGFRGQWRVGRLFKTSLGMIYDRKKRLQNTDENSA